MGYPCLVRQSHCKTDASITIEQEGLSKYGEPLDSYKWDGKVNYQDKVKTVYTDKKKGVISTGSILIPGDICPNLSSISGGEVLILGESRTIVSGKKARNPDGTVNYTHIEVM